MSIHYRPIVLFVKCCGQGVTNKEKLSSKNI